MSRNQLVLGIIACLLLVMLVMLPSPLPGRIGAGDFTAYWSASYLLAHGQNFTDSAQLMQVERALTAWKESWTFSTWNPPWLLTLLLPYTLLPFSQAAWLWMLTCIGLIFTSATLLWQLSAMGAAARSRPYIAPLVAFVFPPTLLALISGQVNILVLAGLVLFLFFEERQEDSKAGAALALTMVKPHLVYITVSLLILESLRRHRWRTLAGFIGVLAGLSVVVLILRPTFLFEYGATTGGAGLLDWQTPTLGGILATIVDWQWIKLMALVILPASVIIWWRGSKTWNIHTLVDVTVMLSLISAPFGWSYDFIILLVPLIRVIAWFVDGEFTPLSMAVLALGLGLLIGVLYYARLVVTNEVYFFWVPIASAGLYAFALIQKKSPQPFSKQFTAGVQL